MFVCMDRKKIEAGKYEVIDADEDLGAIEKKAEKFVWTHAPETLKQTIDITVYELRAISRFGMKVTMARESTEKAKTDIL